MGSKQNELFTRITRRQAEELTHPGALQHVLETNLGHQLVVRRVSVEWDQMSRMKMTAEIEILIEGHGPPSW